MGKPAEKSNVVDDEDDNVSIATTLEEDVDSDQEWLVNTVMAEAEIDGEVRYLIDWHGFPLHEASWEPEENLGEDLLKSWREAREIEPLGKESDFAIWRWRQAVIDRLNERMTRHKERNRRRRERGLQASQTIDTLMSNSLEYLDQMPKGAKPDGIDAVSRPEQTSDSPQTDGSVSGMADPPVSTTHGADKNDVSGTQNDEDVRQSTKAQPYKGTAAPTTARNFAGDPKRKEKAIVSRHSSKRPETHGKPDDTMKVPADAQVVRRSKEKEKLIAQSTKQKQAEKVPKETNIPKAGLVNRGKPSVKPTSPSAVRRPSIPQGEVENVFKGGIIRKQRQTLLQAAKDPTKDPKMLRIRHQWQIQKRSRDREGEIAPSQRPAALISLDPNDKTLKKQLTTPAASVDEHHDFDLEDDDDVQMIDPPNLNQESENLPTTSEPEPTVSNVPPKAQEIPGKASSGPPSGGVLARERPKLGRKKSVRWDDNVIVQEPIDIAPEEPEESLFCPDQQNLRDSPAPKEEDMEETTSISDDAVEQSSSKPEDVAAAKKKVSLDKYRERSTAKSMVKQAKFGTTSEKQLSLTFDGIPRKDANSWVHLFEEEEILTFGHTCTHGDFSMKLAELQSAPLCRGYVTWSADQGSIEAIADNLRLGSLGALCYGTEFCVMVYPTKCEEWETASPHLFENVTNAPLRYIIFQPNATFTSSYLAPFGNYSKASNHESHMEIFPRIHESFFGFDYKRLVPKEVLVTPKHAFYLTFSKSAEQDSIFLALWLRACNPDCQIIPSAIAGSWHSFLKLNRGVIIVHEDAVSTIRSFPGIVNLLHSSTAKVRCWVYSNSLRPWGLFSSLPDTSISLGDIRLDLLFQPGIAVLLTPSFLVAQPEQTYNLLKWFRQNYVEKREVYLRGRLLLCADIGDWYSDLISEKAEMRDKISRFDERNLALHDDAFRARLKVLELLRDLVILVDEYDSPIVLAPAFIDGNDEQSLVNWFGTWTITHLDQFKKFIIVGSSNNQTANKKLRSTRMIKPPVFSRDTVDDPDELYKALDEKEAAKQLQLPRPNPVPQAASVSSEPPLEFIRNDNPGTLIEYLSHLTEKISRQSWCPMIIYKFPVSYWNSDMPYHFGDYSSIFKSYQACYNYFRPFIKNGVREHFNTTAAFFYTVEGSWDPAAYPRDMRAKRRPWFAIFRPANVHIGHWRETELLIWDVTPNAQWEKKNHIYEEDLIEAQRELIRFISQDTEDKHDGSLPLTKVWLNGCKTPLAGHHQHPLDSTLQDLDRFVEDLKFWATAVQHKLPLRGWKEVKPRGSARTPSPPPPPPPDVDTMDIDIPEVEDNPDAKTIFHPPRRDRPSSTNHCRNRLYKATQLATQRGPVDKFEYVFPATMFWYGQQLAEGRGFEHIKITTWESFFESYQIPNPKTTGSRSAR